MRVEYLTIINTLKLPGTTIFSAIVSRLGYKFFFTLLTNSLTTFFGYELGARLQDHNLIPFSQSEGW